MDEFEIIENKQGLTPQDIADKANKTLEAATKLAAQVNTSLDKTQQNALNVSGLVAQVEKISGYDQYVTANNAIMNDPNLSIQEKLKLKRENDAWQDERTEKGAKTVANLQSENAKNAKDATKSWFEPVCCITIGGVILVLSLTPWGRAFASAFIKTVPHVTV